MLSMRRLLFSSCLVALSGCSGMVRQSAGPEVRPHVTQQIVTGSAVSASVPTPDIETANKIAKIDVRERVQGVACVGGEGNSSFPKDLYFLRDQRFDLSTDEGQARAAAAFDALFGKAVSDRDKHSGAAPYYTDDILVAPSYLVQTRRRGPFSVETCVQVVGYRGVVTGFEDSKLRRSSDGRLVNPSQVDSPEDVKGKFSITVF